MFRSDPVPSHRACWKLLPWYVSSTLETAEREGVERHLEGCDACREEVASLAGLRQHVRADRDPAPVFDMAVDRGLQQALRRIDGDSGRWFRASPAVRWVLAGQAAAILVLVSLWVWQPALSEQKTFHTLSARAVGQAPDDDSHSLWRIVFQAQATEIDLRHLLRSVEAEIVAGPSEIGAYTLRVSRAPDDADRLARLRAESLVRLVEPVRARQKP